MGLFYMHAAVIIKYTCKAENCCKIASRYKSYIIHEGPHFVRMVVPKIEWYGVHCLQIKNKASTNS